MDNKEKLDNPLVVHNKNDASYENSDENLTMSKTHTKQEGPTLERHRFKKDRSKSSKKFLAFVIIVLILAVAFCVLYFTGNISFNSNKTTATTETTTETTTTLEQNTYIFVDGEEVEGIEGMQEALRLQEPSTTAYTIINDSADTNFIDNEVVPVLLDMGFYDENTNVTHKSTALIPSELTTAEETVEAETQPETQAEE